MTAQEKFPHARKNFAPQEICELAPLLVTCVTGVTIGLVTQVTTIGLFTPGGLSGCLRWLKSGSNGGINTANGH